MACDIPLHILPNGLQWSETTIEAKLVQIAVLFPVLLVMQFLTDAKIKSSYSPPLPKDHMYVECWTQ
jgi:hypothetical protein